MVKEKQIIHHDAVYNTMGKIIEPEYDEEIIIEADPDVEFLQQCILELGDMIYAMVEGDN